MPFSDARKFARDLHLKREKEWRAYSKAKKLPDNIPATPDRVYKSEGWLDWYDWLGNEKRKKLK